MEFKHDKIIQDGDQYILELYISEFQEEFANELGHLINKRENLFQEATRIAREKYPTIKINTIKILAGAMVIGVINLGELSPIQAGAQTTTLQPVSGVPLVIHTVKSGESLSVIAKQYNVTVTAVQQINGLKTDMIYVGQSIKIPIYSYIVSSGDTLSLIAKKLQTTVTDIKTANKLTSDNIYIGQRLLVPVSVTTTSTAPKQSAPPPPPTTAPAPTQQEQNTTQYTVKSGDSLSLIAKNFGTTVQKIQQQNALTTTNIFIGQVLLIPKSVVEPAPPPAVPTAPTQPAPTTTTYTVVSGDTISLIAKRFNTTVDAIKSTNKLTTDMIFVGQQLTIPAVGTSTTPEPTAPPITNPSPEPPSTTTHTVVSGDTLSLLAKRYNTTVTDIKQLNQLTTDMIYVGQKLTIPAPIVVADTTPPAPPTVGTLAVITQQNVAAYELAGTAEAGARVVITFTDEKNQTVQLETTADPNGNFTMKQGVASIQDGKITIQVKAIDQAGNTSTAFTQTALKDVTAPTNLILNNIETITAKNQQSFTISGTVTGATKIRAEFVDQNQHSVTKEIPVTNNSYNQTVDFSILQDGTISVKLVAVDTHGNESAVKTSQLIKDTASPNAPTINVPSFINSGNEHAITITGKTEPNSLVSMKVSDQTNTLTRQVTADANGDYTVIIDARPFHEGTITIEARSIDQVGNESESYRVQTIKDISVGDLLISELAPINKELSTNYTVKGKGEPTTTVQLTFSDTAGYSITKTIQTDEQGNFTEAVDVTTLQDGVITINAYQTDEANNKSNVFTKVIQKETEAPTLVTLNPVKVATQQNIGNYVVTGTGEPQSTVEAVFTDQQGNEVIHQAKIRADGSFTMAANLNALTGDTLTITVHQSDQLGNKSERTTRSTTIDTTGPATLEIANASTANAETATNFTFTGKTETGASLELELTDGTNTIIYHGSADEDGAFSIITNLSKLADGLISGKISTKDPYQNAGIVKEISLTKDTEITDLTSLDVAGEGKVSSANVDSYTISGVSQEEGAVVTVEVSDGVNTITETALVVDGTFQKPFNLRNLAEGMLQIQVFQQDTAGNTSTLMTKTIEKDTEVVQPVIQVSQLTKTTTGYTYQLRGIGEPNSEVTVNISGQTSPTTITNTYVVNEAGQFQLTIDLAALNGQKPFIIIEQKDAFGNESTPLLIGVSTYVVGSGDNLWKISTLLGTTVQELRNLNNLTTDMIYIGQNLKVPLVAGLQQTAVSEQHSFNMGYLYHGSSNTYMQTMKYTQGSINVVAPTYFDINPDGSLKLTPVLDRYFIASMQSNGIRVVPFLSNHWDRALGEKALHNRETLSTQIAEAVRIYNLDGVNIDIENVTHEYRDEYTEFAQMLRAKIPTDKEVSVAVAANPRDFKLGWHGSYDYISLGQTSDYLMIMAYDESFTGSEPGPVASIQFVEQSIQYAIQNGVPKEKIVLGIGHFGRYWQEGAPVGGNGMANEHVAKAIQMYNGVVTFDQKSMSPKATFTIKEGDPALNVYGKVLNPGNYTVWYENEESIRAKFELVEKYGIKGTGNWGLEQENPAFWSTFSQWVQEAQPVTGEGSQ
ncbi:LysM peptidoglycan-binding domain-containing protein [Bacillus pinisoli]|uniref:LysM peptidoglycan-binding domain-containing protein n=1 Tax=Bacillus pinisoli TaxID=2901866 RepID=UPI001FF68E72|nr:LysM peptidoglycan-binding domain-containing protein [Bacillus pinisoli]